MLPPKATAEHGDDADVADEFTHLCQPIFCEMMAILGSFSRVLDIGLDNIEAFAGRFSKQGTDRVNSYDRCKCFVKIEARFLRKSINNLGFITFECVCSVAFDSAYPSERELPYQGEEQRRSMFFAC